MNTYNKFIKEITDINKWYKSTEIAYKVAIEEFKKQIKRDDIDQSLIDLALGENDSNIKALLFKYSFEHPKHCRELTLIRMISILEVYLIDTIKEIFIQNKEQFLKNGRYELEVRNLLTCTDITLLQERFIDSICRKLHNGGLKELKKFYYDYFKVDFNKFQYKTNGTNTNIKDLEKYHDMRHLIIHRLGIVDDNFRHKYNVKINNIQLSDENMDIIFNSIIRFVSYINTVLQNYIKININEPFLNIKLKILDDIGYKLLDKNLELKIRKNYLIRLDHILKEKKEYEDSKIIELTLTGEIIALRKYHKLLKKSEERREIELLNYSMNNYNIRRKFRQYSLDEVEILMKELPDVPWPKHIHKELAKKLDWSNNKVLNMINYLKTDKKVNVILNINNLILNIDDEFEISAYVSPIEAQFKRLIWKSNNPNIASVKDGVVKAVSAGIVTITAQVVGENPQSKGKCMIEVIE